MNGYKITLTGCIGENPVDAFERVVPGRTLQAVKDPKDASVMIELLNGQRKSVGYYRPAVKAENKVGGNTKKSVDSVKKNAVKKSAVKKEKSEQRRIDEEVIWDFLRDSRHKLEAFVDLDYFGAGADACWDKAARQIDRMSEKKVKIIADRIRNEDYDDYYRLFIVD